MLNNVKPRFGENSFSAAIRFLIDNVLKDVSYTQAVNVIFMSDGKDIYPKIEMEEVKNNYTNKISNFWTVLFGDSQTGKEILQKMADCLKTECHGTFQQKLSA